MTTTDQQQSSVPNPPDHIYRAAFMAMNQGFSLLDIQFDETGRAYDVVIRDANPAQNRINGVQAFIGKRGREFRPDTDLKWIERYAQVARLGETAYFEDWSEVNQRWYEIEAFPVGGPGSSLVAIIYNDITTRKQAEEALRRSEALNAFRLQLGDALRSLADPIGIETTAARLLGEYLGANQVHYAETIGDDIIIHQGWGNGLPPMVGRFRSVDFGEKLTAIHRTGVIQVVVDVEKDPLNAEAERQVLRAARIGAYITVPLVKKEQWVATLAVHSISPRAWTTQDIELVKEVAERTWAAVERARAEAALSASEQKYRAMFEAIGEGVSILEVLFDQSDEAIDYRFVENNPAVERMTGVSNSTGKTVLELFPDFDREFIKVAGEVARTGRPVRFQHFVPPIDRWFDVHETRVGGTGSRTVIAAFADITERKRREANLAFLNEVGQDLVSMTNIDEIMDALGAKIGRHMNLTRCVFAEVLESEDKIIIIRDWYGSEFSSATGEIPLSQFVSESYRQKSRSGEITVVADVHQNSLVDGRQVEALLGITSFVNVPLLRDRQWRFTLGIYDAMPRDWREDEIELLRELTMRIWARLEGARAEEVLRESEERLAIELADTQQLQRISSQLIQEEPVSQLYAQILDAAIALMRSDMGSLQVLDPQRQKLRQLAWKGSHPDSAVFWETASGATGSSYGMALTMGQRLIIPDVNNSDLLKEGDNHEQYVLSGIAAIQSTPLIARNGRVVGMLSTHWRIPHTPGERELRMLDVLARQTADLIERARAEDALRESERFVQGVIASLPLVIYIFDLVTGQNRYLSPQVADLFGYTAEEMQASGPNLLTTFFHPDDQARVVAYFRHITTCGKDAEGLPSVFHIEYRIKHRQQGWVWVESRDIVYARDTEGKPTLLLGTAENISERRANAQALHQSEARLRAILESAKDYAIFTTDLDRRVNSWNRGAQAMFGYTEEEIIEQSADLLFTPEDRQWGAPEHEAQKATSEGRAENERWHIRQDGSRFYGSGVVTPLRNEAGSMVGLLKVMRDLTAQKRAEDSLREADQRKDEFLAMLAHELRNPMATVSNGLNILRLTGETDEVTSQTIGMMNRQVDHLVHLIDDLLDVSRISRNKIELKSERIELGALVAGAVEAIRPQYTALGKHLHLTPAPFPLYVQGDTTRLSQVVTNLLTNGLRYTGQQGQVWVSLAREAGEALLRVRDNGIGLSADQRTAIFELFVQADHSLARQQGGLGIGLTLVRRLLTMHNGRVEARSPGLGQGSEFVVYLPLLKQVINQSIPIGETTASQPARHRILVIDDNADAALTLSMLLRLNGYEVHSRQSGQEGLQAAEALGVTVILCDIGMPEMDGYETARQIRLQPWGSAVTLIALTGYGQEEDKQRAREAGFNGHLIKPVDLTTLTQLLDELP